MLVNLQGEKRMSKTSSKKYNSWIKFEGSQYETQTHNVVSVSEQGRTLYILNYVRRPSGVKDGATVFVACGYKDIYGISQQVIIGRGILAGYSADNVVKEEWIEKYYWMEHFCNYLVLKKFEVLDSIRKNGLLLDQVYSVVGGDTYPSSEGQNISIKDLRRKHTQKMHLMITDKATDYINSELDKLFKLYGVRVFQSE